MLYDRVNNAVSLFTSVSARQSLNFLQRPLSELIEVIREEITLNPMFDLTSSDEFLSIPNHNIPNFPEYGTAWWENLPNRVSATDRIYQQLRLITSCPQTLMIAESILGNLDSRGFLRIPVEEICILSSTSLENVNMTLSLIQKCEPIGVGSRNLKEYLLLQLNDNGHSISDYKLVDDFFDDLVSNKLDKIIKKLKTDKETLLKKFRNIFSKLQFSPLSQDSNFTPIAIPDAYIYKTIDYWTIRINDFLTQNLRINENYLEVIETNRFSCLEHRNYMKAQITAAKRLIHNLHKREETLLNVLTILVHKQSDFLSGKQDHPCDLSVKEVAESLSRHESTIFRAVKNKIIVTPRGFIPLKNLLPKAFVSPEGTQLQKTAIQNLILELTDKENRPLSDKQLESQLRLKGISCARRTITKYRKILNIPRSNRRVKVM